MVYIFALQIEVPRNYEFYPIDQTLIYLHTEIHESRRRKSKFVIQAAVKSLRVWVVVKLTPEKGSQALLPVVSVLVVLFVQ